MTVSLTTIIADLESKIANADSSSSLSDLLSLLNSAERLTGIKSIYDSSELNTTAAEVGSVKYLNDGSLRVYDSSSWRILTDEYVPPWTGLQGTTFGYIAGGQYPTGNNMIQKFSFTSDGNASDVSDLTVARGRMSGTSSSQHGYIAGGQAPANSNVVDRFTFATEGNAVDVGDLLYTVESTASHSDGDFGYISGGYGSPFSPLAQYISVVQRFPFASSITTTDVGHFSSNNIQRHAGVSSTTHGYTMGGKPSASYGDEIYKFNFSASITSSDIGNLTQARQELCGQSSSTHGYATGGYHNSPSPNQTNGIWNTIDKVAFASDGDATDVGDLPSQGGAFRQRSSNANESTTNGYCSGGVPHVIEEMSKFPFASDTNATDIGDLVNPQNALDGAGNMNGR